MFIRDFTEDKKVEKFLEKVHTVLSLVKVSCNDPHIASGLGDTYTQVCDLLDELESKE